MRLFCRRAAVLAAIVACLLAIQPAGSAAQEIVEPDIVAERAIVVDATTGDILLDHGANEPVAMASLTKLFTAFVSIESTPLDRQMTVADYDLVGEASMGLSSGEVLSFETLLHGMLLPSGNDAATAIARNLGARTGDSDSEAAQRFIDRANARIATIGIHNTHLVNPHGLDADGHYSTARDLAALTIYALNHEPTFASVISTPEYSGEGHHVTNTNRLLGSYEGLIGGKTGVTDNAGYCLMQVAEQNGRRIVVVLLGSTPEYWYADAEALLDYGFAASAIPGAAPRFGQISFASAPAVTAPTSEPIAGLAVTESAAGTAVVSQLDIAGTPRRSPWLWIVSAIVVAPAALVTVTQFQRGSQRRSHRRTTRPAVARPRAAIRTTYDQAPAWRMEEGSAAGTANWQHVAPDYHFDETMDWRLPAARPTRNREDRSRQPVLFPSYGGD
jgi:D-alanyl-D-alanine carboxypeptidase